MHQEENKRTAAEWYELASEVEHVVTDQAVRTWRNDSLIRAGFRRARPRSLPRTRTSTFTGSSI